MTAAMLVGMMAVFMHVLMGVNFRDVRVGVALMGMGYFIVYMLMLVFVLAVATHPGSPPCQ